MSSLSWSVHVIATVSGLMYTTSVTSIALVAALGRDAERRQHARETLKILVRYRSQRLRRETW
jgi:hypothetical protein